MLSDLLFRLRALVRGRRLDEEMADELRFHLEREIEKLVRSGMSRDEATRQARLAFGGIDQTKDACRDARGISFVETLLQDVRYGVRAMRRSPASAMATIVTIALSSAAIATVASLGYTLLWRPLTVDRPNEVVAITAAHGRANDGIAAYPVSYPDYVSFRDRTTTLAALAAHYPFAPLFVTANGTAREVNGAVVSANYFSLLGIEPEQGRFFHADEDRVPDRDRVAVIGHDFWRTWLNASPTAIGSSLTVNGVPVTIIGIAPASVPMLTPVRVNIYIPTMMLRVGYRWCDALNDNTCNTLQMVGRLAPDRTLEDANTEFAAILPAKWKSAPIGQNRGVLVRRPRGMSEDDDEPRFVAILAGAAIVLWIVCCINLAGLLTAQSSARAPEFAIRVSLGAGRIRIIRQVVTESLLLATIGGIGGVLVSRGFIAVLARMFFSTDDEGHVLFYDFSPTTWIVVATVAAALAAGLIFSVIPALNAVNRANVTAATRTASGRWSTTRWLLGAQAAAAVAMIGTAALLYGSARMILAGRHYDTSHVALMRLRPRLLKYTPERAQRFQHDVIRRLAALPSVESASLVGVGAVLGGGTATLNTHMRVRYNEIGPAYFATLRAPLVAGREFDERDTLQSPRVAIVNETLASRLAPASQALGAAVTIDGTTYRVVGVVADLTLQARNHEAEPWAYTPFWQNAGEIDSRLAVRVSGDPATALPALAREVHAVDPDVPIAETITLPTQMVGLTRPIRVGAVFVGYAAALATMLTAVGLYGALASAVARRTKEIGIRLALGARRQQVVGAIVRDGVLLVTVGSMVGMLLARAASRAVVHLLYGSPAGDWMLFAAAALAVVTVGVVASLLPARRAAAVEPISALRQE